MSVTFEFKTIRRFVIVNCDYMQDDGLLHFGYAVLPSDLVHQM